MATSPAPTKAVTVRLPKRLYDRVSREARRAGLSRSAWIQREVEGWEQREEVRRAIDIVALIERTGAPDADALEQHQDWPEP